MNEEFYFPAWFCYNNIYINLYKKLNFLYRFNHDKVYFIKII